MSIIFGRPRSGMRLGRTIQDNLRGAVGNVKNNMGGTGQGVEVTRVTDIEAAVFDDKNMEDTTKTVGTSLRRKLTRLKYSCYIAICVFVIIFLVFFVCLL